MYERIIFADDGSPLARSAAPRVAAIAAANDSHVLVVRVSRAAGIDPDDIDYYAWDHYFTDRAREEAASNPLEAEPHLSDVVRDLEARGVSRVGSVVLKGEAAETLTETADELEANLLVMTSRGTGGLKRAMLGSVAEHLVRHARETPLLLCPPPEDEVPRGIARVLLTMDGSGLCRQAAPYAEHLARSLGVPLVLLQVTESEEDLIRATVPGGLTSAHSLPPEEVERIAAAQREAAEGELRATATAMRERGCEDVTFEVRSGHPSTQILAAADELQADVIVMATRGRGGLGRLLLGSVADTVSRQSERAAVLLIRPDDDAIDEDDH